MIGTGISRELDAAGHDVTVYARGETDATLPEDVAFVAGDRRDHDRFERDAAALRTGEASGHATPVDAVVDLVCFDRADAEAAIRAFTGVDRYVFCSTIDVYRRPVDAMPVAEDAPRRPPTTDCAAGRDRPVAAFEGE